MARLKLRSRTALLVGAGLLAGVIALGVLGGVAQFVLAREDVVELSVDHPVRHLVVQEDSGDIEILPSPDGITRVRADRRYVTERPALEPQLEGDTLRIVPDCGEPWFFGDCEVSLRIEVPAGVTLDLDTDAGDVEVKGHDGGGDVTASSDAGDVRLELGAVPTRVRADSDAGDVIVRVPRGTYAVEAGTDAGDTEVEGLVQDDAAPRTIEANSDAGDVRVTAAGG